MVTKQQALTCREFHFGACKRTVGPRGAVTVTIERWRASGQCQTWKTRPAEFRLPVKFGLYSNAAITHTNADQFHAAEDCPLG